MFSGASMDSLNESHGHATAAELAYVLALEAKVGSAPAISAIEDLVAVYIDPCHRYDLALSLIERHELMERSPRAGVWFAVSCIHYLMDREALQRAHEVLRGLQFGEQRGAASMLLVECLEELFFPYPGGPRADEKERLLRDSIAAEPTWSSNFVLLGRLLLEAGNQSEPIIMVRTASDNRISAADLELSRYAWETYITGRARSPEELLMGFPPGFAESVLPSAS